MNADAIFCTLHKCIFKKFGVFLETPLSQWVETIFSLFMFVCLFQEWDGYRVLPRFPTLPDGHVRICRNPQSREFPPHHYSGLGTRIRKWNIIGSYSFFMFPHPPPEICYSFTEYKILKYALLTFKLHRLNSDSDNTYRYLHISLTNI